MSRTKKGILTVDADTSETYGRLVEGLHITGYTFERAMANLIGPSGLMREGRWKMGGRFNRPNDFLETLRFDKMRVLADQRKEFSRLMKELEPDVSNRQIGRTLGVSKDTVRGDNSPPRNKKMNQIKGGKSGSGDNSPALSGERAAKLVLRRETASQDRRDKVAADESRVLALRPAPGKYRTIVLDPAWEYSWLSLAGRAKPGYAMQTLEQLEALDVSAWADETAGCQLYVWTTNNFMQQAAYLVAHWGFQHRVVLTWIKPPPFGLGSYFRNSTEHVLFATRGDTTTRPAAASIPTHFEAPRGEHSEKPEKFYEIVRAASYPPYGEANQRAPRPDFTSLFCPVTERPVEAAE